MTVRRGPGPGVRGGPVRGNNGGNQAAGGRGAGEGLPPRERPVDAVDGIDRVDKIGCSREADIAAARTIW